MFVLKIEVFGDDVAQYHRVVTAALPRLLARHLDPMIYRKPWVAEIIGLDKQYGFARSFLHGRKDYSLANGIGSRGVYLWYDLESSRIYEVKEQKTWRAWDRYYCRVEANQLIRMDRDEVLRCLSAA